MANRSKAIKQLVESRIFGERSPKVLCYTLATALVLKRGSFRLSALHTEVTDF